MKSTVDTSAELSSRELEVANIRTKLGLASRTAAAAHAVRAGLI
jgi:hypothetical protein